LVFPGSDYPHNRNADFIINDRKILEFIFSYEGKKIISGEDWPKPLDRIKINSLDMIPASYVSQSETVSKAAKLLSSIYTPALLSENNIITPWDIVMKTLRRDFSSRS
jgi:hypothetical protein